jgi:thiaminase
MDHVNDKWITCMTSADSNAMERLARCVKRMPGILSSLALLYETYNSAAVGAGDAHSCKHLKRGKRAKKHMDHVHDECAKSVVGRLALCMIRSIRHMARVGQNRKKIYAGSENPLPTLNKENEPL